MRQALALTALAALASCRGTRGATPGCGADPGGGSWTGGRPVVLTPKGPIDGAAAPCDAVGTKARGAAHATSSGRTFHVWTPTTYDGSRAYPVVFAVHGWYSNGRDFQKWFKMEDHTDNAALVVYPDAKTHVWDVSGTADLEFFDAMLDGLAASYCVDRSRVFALGFSYGGKMVHHLGCKRSDRYRAISVGDGSWADGVPACGRLPVLVTHRTRDHDELFAWGLDAAKRWARVNGCSEETDPSPLADGCRAFRACSADASVLFCEDAHFDPAWPKDWNHTIREPYRSLTWRWFDSFRGRM